ncbi:MAG TPA: CAP domain-containing protein [Terriglobia bacterium]|nr:CAP domain-containing protein [Terriglobia bacterium]
MIPIPGGRGVIVFTVLAWWVTTTALALIWIVTPGQWTLAAAPQSSPPSAPQSVDQKRNELGVWHHFGESQSPPPPATRQSGTWRHFGDGGNPPLPPRAFPTSRNLRFDRTREMEQLMVELVNRDRADPANTPETNGRAQALRWNDTLAAVARAHSLDMLNQRYFSHQDAQGRSVAKRVEAAGMEWQAVGENIAIYGSVAGAEAAFMNEPRFTKNHRANILDPDFAEVGIGIVQAPNGSLYITQDFYKSLGHSAAR